MAFIGSSLHCMECCASAVLEQTMVLLPGLLVCHTVSTRL